MVQLREKINLAAIKCFSLNPPACWVQAVLATSQLFTVPAWMSHTPEHLHILFLAYLCLWSQLTLKLSSEGEKFF